MRDRWEDFMGEYERILRETSCEHAHWYAIPADSKPYMRRVVAEIVCNTLKDMNPQYPSVSQEEIASNIYFQDQEPGSNAVEVTIGRIRKKIRTTIIETKRGFGYTIAHGEP